MRRMIGCLLVLVFLSLVAAGAEPWSPPSLTDFDSALSGLGFDEFIETSYRMYLLRYPQSVTSTGLAAEYGIRNDALNDYSQEYSDQTEAIEWLILTRLLGFDPSELTPSQRETYDICVWYWDDVVRGSAFADYVYPVHFMDIRSWHGLLQFLLESNHPLETEADIEDYVSRLERIGAQFDQIIEQLDRRAELGIIAPRMTLQWAIGDIRGNAYASDRHHPLLVHLEDAVDEIEGVPQEAIDAQLVRATEAITAVVKPAYRRLYDKVNALIARAPDAISLSQFEGGAEAYAHLLRHHTQTDLTAAEIHALGIREVARVQSEARAAAARLGMEGAESASMTDVFAFAAREGGAVSGDEAIEVAEQLIEKAKRVVTETGALSRLPSMDVIAVGATSGGYYSPGPMDGSRPGAYYVTTGGSGSVYRMSSVAYHETIPGHHVQIALAQELDLPLIRQDVIFTGFSEGWALYAERLMSELGAYDDDPYGDLGRLQYELLRAVRLVVDTGIHDLGWSHDEAVAYIMQNNGDSKGTADYRALRYTLLPGQATAYMVGMLELLDLRDRARTALGDAFDLPAFHDTLLGSGNVPLTYVDGLVEAWIEESLP